MYKEIEKFKVIGTIAAEMEINGQIVKVDLDRYDAPLGEIICDLIRLERKPFWKRKSYDSHLKELYLKFLNKITLTQGF